MSRNPSHPESLHAHEDLSPLAELPAPVAAEGEAHEVRGGLNPQPLPPRWWYSPVIYTPYLYRLSY